VLFFPFAKTVSKLIDESVVTDFFFAHESNILADGAKAAIFSQNNNELLMGININKHFP